jgi:hypothetical protein
VWKVNGTGDVQCSDFLPYYDFARMKLKPTALIAAYSADGSSITITFNVPVRQDAFADCSQLFETQTLNYLPKAKAPKWLSTIQLEIAYDPEAGILQTLEFSGNALYYDYVYAQEPIEKASLKVRQYFLIVR